MDSVSIATVILDVPDAVALEPDALAQLLQGVQVRALADLDSRYGSQWCSKVQPLTVRTPPQIQFIITLGPKTPESVVLSTFEKHWAQLLAERQPQPKGWFSRLFGRTKRPEESGTSSTEPRGAPLKPAIPKSAIRSLPSADVIAGWERIGGVVGWVKSVDDPFSPLHMAAYAFRRGPTAEEGEELGIMLDGPRWGLGWSELPSPPKGAFCLIMHKIRDTGLPSLAALPTLHTLFIADREVAEKALYRLDETPNLRGLDLFACKNVTDAVVATISKKQSLLTLNLWACGGVSDTGVNNLSSLHQLTTLKLHNTKVSDVGLKAIGELSQLRHLCLNSTRVSDAGMQHLGRLSNLQHLDLQATAISDHGVSILNDVTTLTDLSLAMTQVTTIPLHRLTALRKLNLTNTKVTDHAVKDLNQRASLRSLNLCNTSIGGSGLEGYTGLQELNLSLTNVSDDSLRGLATLTELQRLELVATRVTGSGFAHLSRLTGLHTLNLSQSRITDAGLKGLAVLPALHTLNLENTQVSDAGLKELVNLKCLRKVNIRKGTRVTPAGLSALSAALGGFHSPLELW